MKTASSLLAALLLTLASGAYAQASAPTKPTTGQGAATTVQTNPAATESKGKADQGLDTAVKNITKPKKHTGKHEGMDRKTERGEKAEHPARADRPDTPERPGR